MRKRDSARIDEGDEYHVRERHGALWLWLAGVTILFSFYFVGLGQKWPMLPTISLESAGDRGMVGRDAALFGMPVVSILFIWFLYATRVWFRYYPPCGGSRWLPSIEGKWIPDQLARSVRWNAIAWAVVLIWPLYSVGYLYSKFIQGQVYELCENAAQSGCSSPSEDRDGKSFRQVIECKGVLECTGAHLRFRDQKGRLLVSERKHWDYQFRYNDVRGYHYFPGLQGVVYTLLFLVTIVMWAQVVALNSMRLLWTLVRRRIAGHFRDCDD